MSKLIDRLLERDNASPIHSAKTRIQKVVQTIIAQQKKQQVATRQMMAHGRNLIRQLFVLNDPSSNFNLEGTPQEIAELKAIIRMLASVSAGRQLLKKVTELKGISKISFNSGLENEAYNADGVFRIKDKSIEIVKIDTSIPEMRKNTRLESRAMMASILAHELQHSIDFAKKPQLMELTSNANELVLICILQEMNAYMHQDKIENQLWGKFSFTSRKQRTKELKEALSGKDPFYKDYIDQARQAASEEKSFSKPTPAFKTGVEDYLKAMHINMSFAEAMSYVAQSEKLLPHPRHRHSGVEK